MLLRMSSLFLRTLRDDPADAEVPSHKLLVRAGYVRRVAPGVYSWLPLGKMVLENVTRIVREEMDRMGGQEVLFPALLPREYYEATGRWTEYGDTLFRLKDRKGADYLLGPTHEEMFTDMVKGEYASYKDYPVTLYQIQTKYRDEARPRAGILRGREFVMKDSYSFDLDDEGLKHSYERHRETYIKIFDRLGIGYKIVLRHVRRDGRLGVGGVPRPAATGEDTFVACRHCGYAANAEAVTTPAPAAITGERPAQRGARHPRTPRPSRRWSPTSTSTTASTSPPRRDAQEHRGQGDQARFRQARDTDHRRARRPRGRLQAAGGLVWPPASPPSSRPRTSPGTPAWSAATSARRSSRSLGIRYLVDPRVVDGTAWVTGANEPGKHAVGRRRRP